jgi:enediyne biosynthesis protein E4
MASRVHFGLAEADKVDRLTIRWPSGRTQLLTDLTVDRHIVVDEDKEGKLAVETVVPGTVFAP